MNNTLIALYGDKEVGQLHYENDKVSFTYAQSWSESPTAFPLSLSMPLTASTHADKVVSPFIAGLLPDNSFVLNEWGKRFHVSPRNPFRLLTHVGEECAGAVQFFSPERLDELLPLSREPEVTWLTDVELNERIAALVADHSKARRIGDQGHFSLAGAQPKTALYYDEVNQRWGIPYGVTPTTHILKPNTGDFDNYDINEHFCLRLAEKLGMSVAKSSLQTLGGHKVIVVKRFDRISLTGNVLRVHQEDTCQALACSPGTKYENEGGPSAKDIFGLIRNFSSKPQQDVQRFLDALLLNWLIGGTDAHSKNYGFLLAGGGQVRLAPLYDISSCLPYPKDIPLRKACLAMKVGGKYQLSKIGRDQWGKAAKEWAIPLPQIENQLSTLNEKMAPALHATKLEIQSELEASSSSQNHSMLNTLTVAILQRSQDSSA